MLNYIASYFLLYLINGPMQDPYSDLSQSDLVPEGMRLGKLLGETYRLHTGLFIMIAIVIIMIFFWKTSLGYKIDLTGQGEKVATYAGINVKQTVIITMCISGAFSGVAGWIETFGINYRLMDGIRSLPAKITPFQSLHFPVLSDIPYLGTVFFQHNILVYLAFALVPITWFILEKTTFGLKIKAVGEHPRAADSKGISVSAIRYAAIIIGGAYAGAGGVFMTIAYLNMFTESVIGGFGYIAVSVVIFARFDPKRAMWGSLLFGFASALQVRLQALGSGIPSQLLLMLPYIMTIIALIFASKKAEFPSAYTQPYSRLDR